MHSTPAPTGAHTSPLVHFVICGTQKGGTSALDSYLREHPQVCMAAQKELHFFDNEDNFSRSAVEYSAYHSFFSPKSSHIVLGESTPSYMYWYDAPRRLWTYNSMIKLIVLLRNPIERAYSHWNMERARNAESLSFWDAIRNEKIRCRVALPYQHRVYSYIDRGFYLEQLRRLWTYFPEDQVLVLRSDDLRDNHRSTLRSICAFLGIDDFDHVEQKTIHSLGYPTSMEGRARDYLASIYEHEIRGLEQVLNWDCRDWLSR